MIGDNSFAASGSCSMGFASGASIDDRIYFLNERVEGLPGIIFWRTDQPELHLAPPRFSRAVPPLAQVVRLEVTQGVQNWNNSLTLVRNRRTVVRAFMETRLGRQREITAKLEGQKIPADDDFPQAETTNPVNPSMSVMVMDNVADRRGNIDASLNFVLPEHWTDLESNEGLKLKLVFEAGANANCIGAIPVDNRCEERVEFTEIDPPKIVMVPVPVTNTNDTPDDTSDDTLDWRTRVEMIEQFNRIESIMPFPSQAYRSVGGSLQIRVPKGIGGVIQFVDFGPFERATNFTDILGGLNALQGASHVGIGPFQNVYLGVLSGSDGGVSGGRAIIGGFAAAWFTQGVDGVATTNTEAYYGYFRNIGGHELGHALGEQHAADEDKDGDGFFEGECEEQTGDTVRYDFMRSVTTSEGVTEERPVLGPLGDVNTEVWGFDTRYVNRSFRGAYAYIDIFNNLAVINPYEVFSFMSYCDPVNTNGQGLWMDAFHHKRIIDNYKVSSSQPSSRQVNAEEESSSVSSDIFSGSVLLSSSGTVTGAQFEAVFSWNRTPVASQNGNHVLELRDANGVVVKRVLFDTFESVAIPSSNNNTLSQEQRRANFAFVVSDPPAYESFAVIKDGVEVASVSRSQNAPSISVSGPSAGDVFNNGETINVSWVGSDTDGDELIYRVYYSIDGGSTYRILSPMTKATSKSFSALLLEGSSQSRIGVSVSDGTRSAFAETHVFSVAGHAPEVWVESPSSGAVFAEEQGFVLEATGYDTEDGLLASSSFGWSSSIDGDIGTGSYLVLSADNLTPGSHTITLTATDSENMTATANVDITISARNMLPVANDDEAFGGLEESLQIDVLANDIDTEKDFDLSSLAINRRPRLGIAEVTMAEMGMPVIEYSPITGGEDSFTYSICDGLYRCNTAEVTVVFPDCTITGTRGSDNLVGTSGADVICGLDGDDTIDGKGGDDLIYAGFGEDLVYGRTGDDTIYGGPGNDLILGHRGDDTIYGGLSNDRLWGGEGDDTIYGGAETDELYGEADEDMLYGNDGPDTIHGGRGDDVIYGGDGDDTIRGNAGADTIYPGIGSDTLLGTSPVDVVIEEVV